jgi:hypothetical protein
LEQLGFQEQYERRYKMMNVALNQLFAHWLEQFRTAKGKPLKVCDSSAFLDKEMLTELVDWIVLCGLILDGQVLPNYYKNRQPALLEEAQRYCPRVQTYKEMQAFVFELPTYLRFQEALRTCLYDCFYWYNSY